MAKEEDAPSGYIEEEEEKTYANPILYLHRSKAGGHLYAFNVVKDLKEGDAEDTEMMVLGGEVESLLMNISDVSAVINGEMKWCKVSVMPKREHGE